MRLWVYIRKLEDLFDKRSTSKGKMDDHALARQQCQQGDRMYCNGNKTSALS
jgi:hypothetical protein